MWPERNLKLKTLNFHKIGKQHELPAVIKLLAREFIEGATYFSVGKWLKELSQYDLDMLNEMGEAFSHSQMHGYNIMLLTEMLSAAEGIDVLDIDGATRRVAFLITILLCESLYRKGNIEFDHSIVSFGEHEMNQTIAWPKGQERPKDKK